jgi:hypothetical protein
MGGRDYTVNRQQVVDEVIDGEAVMINLVTGCYYCTNAVGALVWQGVTQGASTEQIATALSATFDGAPTDVADQVSAMLQRLEAEGLVVVGEPNPAASLQFERPDTAYAAPDVEVFNDLNDLLLLDPVHDVDPAGWPHAST